MQRKKPIVKPLIIITTFFCSTMASSNGVLPSSADPVLASMTTLPQLRELPYAAGINNHLDTITASHAFSSMYCSVGEIDLQHYGYIEREFLQSGYANIYTLDANNRAAVKNDNKHKYATRLLVRYPSDPDQFSGRAYIDILNASSGIDLEDLWRRSSQYILDNGHAYIGITSKSLTAQALERFDSQRYQELQWQVNGVDENGLLWDALSQLGSLLRQPKTGGLLGKLEPDWLYLTGQSQSGMVLNTYLVAFADRLASARDGKSGIFDGYLNLVGPSVKPISSNGALPSQVYHPSSVPLIVIMSEAEHAMARVKLPKSTPKIAEYQRPKDSNTDNAKFRFYEVAGAPHADPTSPVLPNNAEIGKANLGKIRTPLEYASGHIETELNIDPFVNAALENLHQWAVHGIPAPPADLHWIKYAIDHRPDGSIIYSTNRDSIGNALGGLRAPQIEVPLHRFYAIDNNERFAFSGSMVVLNKQQLQKKYPNGRDDYLRQFNTAADTLVKQKYLLIEDTAKLKSWAAGQLIFEAND